MVRFKDPLSQIQDAINNVEGGGIQITERLVVRGVPAGALKIEKNVFNIQLVGHKPELTYTISFTDASGTKTLNVKAESLERFLSIETRVNNKQQDVFDRVEGNFGLEFKKQTVAIGEKSPDLRTKKFDTLAAKKNIDKDLSLDPNKANITSPLDPKKRG